MEFLILLFLISSTFTFPMINFEALFKITCCLVVVGSGSKDYGNGDP